MGASDWAGRMAKQLEEEFGTPTERNLRITSLVRWFASNPEYEGLFDGNRNEEWRTLTNDLPEVLREESGSTIEERWNNLMDELGYQEIVEGGVYLIPWEDYDETTYKPDVSHSWVRK
ncbi:hypothetical protein [Halomontanus rarus]|uniref:hypothetical protein n=1 Tax=Halomontanus rarus TaxID=3034020 RepID=UPI00293C05C2|nr:hypothetical protein [Halovivax sp. KZCA124]